MEQTKSRITEEKTYPPPHIRLNLSDTGQVEAEFEDTPTAHDAIAQALQQAEYYKLKAHQLELEKLRYEDEERRREYSKALLNSVFQADGIGVLVVALSLFLIFVGLSLMFQPRSETRYIGETHVIR